MIFVILQLWFVIARGIMELWCIMGDEDLHCSNVSITCYKIIPSITINSLRPSDAYMRRWSNPHGFIWWLVAWSAPSHYLYQCWIIVNWALRKKLQRNCNRIWYISIHENASENVIWTMAAILSRPQWMNGIHKAASAQNNDTRRNMQQHRLLAVNHITPYCIISYYFIENP